MPAFRRQPGNTTSASEKTSFSFIFILQALGFIFLGVLLSHFLFYRSVDVHSQVSLLVAEVKKSSSEFEAFQNEEGYGNKVSRDYSQLSSVDRRRQELLDLLEDGIVNPVQYNSVINEFNYKIPPRNTDKFPQLAKDAIPIMLVVHRRDTYLRYTLEQYRMNRGINETLLVISHDGVYPLVRQLIDSVDFCQVKQLIFPYNYDNLERLGKVEEVGLSLGRNHGTLKLHWVWVATQVRSVIGPQFGDVAYMEDDFWISPDFYPALKRMRDVRTDICPDCFGSVVGEHPHDWTSRMRQCEQIFRKSPQLATKLEVTCPRNSMAGLAIPKAQWDTFVKHSHLYCNLDSNHWDDPLHYMMGKDGNYTIPPYILKTPFPRVTHVGRCGGLHFRGEKKDKSKICDVHKDAMDFERIWIEPWVSPASTLLQQNLSFIPLSEETMKTEKKRCIHKYSSSGVGVATLHPLNTEYKRTCNLIAQDPFSHQQFFTSKPNLGLSALQSWKQFTLA